VTPGLLSTWKEVSDFLFAGNATMTLKSLNTGVRFTYKVRAKKEDLEKLARVTDLADRTADVPYFTENDVVYFVNLLRGPDNENDYLYIGVLRRPGSFHLTAASKIGRSAPAFKALVWALDALRCERAVLGQTLEVWHEGRCGRCGRKLTVPESIQSGWGPECRAALKEAA